MMEEGGVNKVDDMGDAASMICSKHPFKTNSSNNNPGGICAFCLQDKLGKLVSSSFPMTIFPSSSSSSPSSRSESFNVLAASANTTNSTKVTTLSSSSSSSISHFHSAPKDSNFQSHYPPRRARFPFLSTHRKKKKKEQQQLMMMGMGASLKRSKSTTTPRNGFLHGVEDEDYTPHRRKFWSFFYLSSKPLNTPRRSAINQTNNFNPEEVVVQSKVKAKDLIEEEVISTRNPTNPTSFERKVSRSRSVGCGSRSFSGDFFERISTGLGDCTLRRVESQREGKSKVTSATSTAVHGGENHHCIKERVRCGGIFGGFIMTSSSSSSSSSIQWVPPNAEEPATAGPVVTRSKNWAWAFASPMRAFSKPSSSGNKDGKSGNNNSASKTITAPNLASIPSLLAVRT